VSAKKDTVKPDWEKIAKTLAGDVLFAVRNLVPRGGGMGMIMDLSKPSSEMVHWKDRFADNLEMVPGVKIDREMMHIQSLSRAARHKATKKLLAQREKAKAEGRAN